MSEPYRDLFLHAVLVSGERLRLQLLDDPASLHEWVFRQARMKHPPADVLELEDLSELGLAITTEETRKFRAPLVDAAQARTWADKSWRLIQQWIEPALRKLVPIDQHKGTCLRLNIVTAYPSLWNVPWEWLEMPLRALLEPDISVLVTRAWVVQFSPPRLRINDRLRLLVTASDAKDESALNVWEELRPFRALQGIDVRESPAIRQSLKSELRNSEANVLHFIGHAGVDGMEGNLILKDATRDITEWTAPRGVLDMIQPSLRLLCLSTCVTAPNYDIRGFGRFAYSAFTGRDASLMPSIVYTQFPVRPEVSEKFWTAFYGHLSSDGNLYEALMAGRQEVRSFDPATAEWSSFVLVVKDQFGDQPGCPFAVRPGTAEASAAPGYEPLKDIAPTISVEQIQSYFASNLASGLASQIQQRLEPLNPETSKNTAELQSILESVKRFIRE